MFVFIFGMPHLLLLTVGNEERNLCNIMKNNVLHDIILNCYSGFLIERYLFDTFIANIVCWLDAFSILIPIKCKDYTTEAVKMTLSLFVNIPSKMKKTSLT